MIIHKIQDEMAEYAKFITLEDGIELIQVSPIGPTQAQFDKCLNDFFELLINVKDNSILIIDLSEAKIATASQKAQTGYFYRENRKLLKAKLMAIVYITPSPLMKLALNSVIFIGNLPFDFKIVADENKAMSWIRQKLRSANN